MSDRPNYEVAATAVAKLDAQFGAENVTQPQRLAEMRILTNTRPDTVTAAVARASRDWCRRPNLDELGQLLRDELHRFVCEAEDLTDPTEIPGRVANLRELLAGRSKP